MPRENMLTLYPAACNDANKPHIWREPCWQLSARHWQLSLQQLCLLALPLSWRMLLCLTRSDEMSKKFGELSIDEKLELHRAFYEGKPVQYWVGDHMRWETKRSSQFYDHLVYRIAPEPETDIELPWHVISPEYQWAARDANGAVWVYEKEPSPKFDGFRWWCGDDQQWCKHLIHKPGNKPWDQSLIKRPEGV